MSNKVVTFGEIMLRLAPPGFLRFSQANNFDVVYGGGESNVAVSLANYGIPVDFVTRLPQNDIGECALMEMRKRGVNTQNIIFGGDRLGIYFLETGAVSRGSKVVYDRAHSAMAEITAGMINDQAKVIYITQCDARTTQVKIQAHLAQIADFMHSPYSFDPMGVSR